MNNGSTSPLKIELDRELISKSATASNGFFMLAIWVMYSKLGTVIYADLLFYIGLSLTILAISRFTLGHFYEKNVLSLERAALFTKANILINGILWMLAVCIAVIEYRFSDFNTSMMAVSLALGLSMASVLTLCYNVVVAFSFQWLLNVPLLIYLSHLYKADGNTAALNASIFLTIAVLYMIRQTRHAHMQVVNRINYALDLKNSNELLKQSQELLLQETAKLQHATRLATLGEISGEVAHEINNPLAIINGNISLIMHSIDSDHYKAEAVKDRLVKALSAIERINKIIKGLRHFSRQTDRDAFVSHPLDEIIHDSVEFCSEKFSYNQISLEVKADKNCLVMCRPIEISQVLLNILSNAINAVSEVPFGERSIKIEVQSSRDQYQIHISNTGVKINEFQREKLFQPFFSTKRAGEGTGIGLSISKAIIEAHKGRLYYDSSQVNTTFVVELPKEDGLSLATEVK